MQLLNNVIASTVAGRIAASRKVSGISFRDYRKLPEKLPVPLKLPDPAKGYLFIGFFRVNIKCGK